jgi:hypothetical protein
MGASIRAILPPRGGRFVLARAVKLTNAAARASFRTGNGPGGGGATIGS